MNFTGIKIGSQLKLGFGALLGFVAVLGFVSHMHTGQISQQTEIMYNHPLKVRSALGSIQADILSMRLGTRDLMIAKTDREKQDAILLMELSGADALRQFEVLKTQYLGPQKDIDEAYAAFFAWKNAREENTRLALSGEIEEVKASVLSTGKVGALREGMLLKIGKIDDFAKNKAEGLFAASTVLHDSLDRRLIALITVILSLSLLISYLLLRNIRNPITALTDVTQRFHKGDTAARSTYAFHNEFGVLSDSFNILAEGIQHHLDLNQKAAAISGLMLSEEDAEIFFHTTLTALSRETNSQIAGVYLLSEDKKYFDHFVSIGAGDAARQSFAAENFEGEFGAALASRTVQYINAVPDETRFIFHTMGGSFVPREIITIPIVAGADVIAIISLASVNRYSALSMQLVDSLCDTLSARISGILAYRKMEEFSARLELQNHELENQKTELASQSSELIAQNTELEIQKNQLDEASRLKTNFLSNMSHELRTPLNSVIALSGVLNRRLTGQIPEEEYSYLEVIERNGKNLLALINDILDISRIEAGREEIEVMTFNANALIAEVVGMIRPQADQKAIVLEQVGDGGEISISSDLDKIRHILQNLIGNAVKFTETGSIKITARQSNDILAITVADTGIGIAEDHVPHIFDEFRQADSSTSRKFGGTGLGLAIAKKYANLLGGTIGVASVPGEGSAFTLSLPMQYASENRITEPGKSGGIIHPAMQTSARPTPSVGKTILLVEDSEPAIIQIRDILEESGYNILVARDGGEALDIIARTVPEAMILDLMMPGIDGFDVLKSIREAERTAHIPVLILTAKHITKDELKFLKRNNVHQLIQKGDVNRPALQNAVAAMVRSNAAAPAKPARTFQTIEGKPVVLVVEDNPDNMLTMKALLADRFTVIEAVDGKGSIEKAKDHKPHLILMDIGLPGMDGIEAYTAMRMQGELQHVPIIALTASAMTQDREIILAHGFDGYIAKPIDEKIFFSTIHEAIYGG